MSGSMVPKKNNVSAPLVIPDEILNIPKVLAIKYQELLDRDDVESIANEEVVKAFLRYDPSYGVSLKWWIFNAAISKVKWYLNSPRRRKERKFVSFNQPMEEPSLTLGEVVRDNKAPDPYRIIEDSDTYEFLLSKLTIPEREVLALRVQGYTFIKIADFFKMSKYLVKQSYRSSVKKLKRVAGYTHRKKSIDCFCRWNRENPDKAHKARIKGTRRAVVVRKKNLKIRKAKYGWMYLTMTKCKILFSLLHGKEMTCKELAETGGVISEPTARRYMKQLRVGKYISVREINTPVPHYLYRITEFALQNRWNKEEPVPE